MWFRWMVSLSKSIAIYNDIMICEMNLTSAIKSLFQIGQYSLMTRFDQMQFYLGNKIDRRQSNFEATKIDFKEVPDISADIFLIQILEIMF